MKRSVIFIAVAACFLTSACAQKDTATSGSVAQEYLNLWLKEYHPEARANASGIYILEDEAGTGAVWDKDILYSLLTVTIRTLNGTISTVGHEGFAKQLGTYAQGNYYGPSVTFTSTGYAGVEALLEGMRAGGTRTAIIPAWLLTTDRYSTQEEYLDACSSVSSLIYTITFAGQFEDLAKWEQENVKQYASSTFGSLMKPAVFNDATKEADIFYFYTLGNIKNQKDTLERGKKYTLNYTGRLLNGQVFDTTEEKVAKDNGIYSSDRTYAPVTITSAESYENYALDGNTSLVDGFKGALSLMKYEGEKSVAVFTSDLGYLSSGSGLKIPPYAPLRFDFEIVAVSE
jgi:hypothetical protein